MSQKIIKIGKSSGITIPKNELEKGNLKLGDQVSVTFDEKHSRYILTPEKRSEKTTINKELIDWTDRFIQDYGPALRSLADK